MWKGLGSGIVWSPVIYQGQVVDDLIDPGLCPKDTSYGGFHTEEGIVTSVFLDRLFGLLCGGWDSSQSLKEDVALTLFSFGWEV
jgi:hypothetical protein